MRRSGSRTRYLLVGFPWRIETDGGWAVGTARMLDVVMKGLAVREMACA
jgi:hypothetical protein